MMNKRLLAKILPAILIFGLVASCDEKSETVPEPKTDTGILDILDGEYETVTLKPTFVPADPEEGKIKCVVKIRNMGYSFTTEEQHQAGARNKRAYKKAITALNGFQYFAVPDTKFITGQKPKMYYYVPSLLECDLSKSFITEVHKKYYNTVPEMTISTEEKYFQIMNGE